jgi:hypothetical protein
MATSLADILAALQNGVTAIQTLTQQISVTFPQATGVSTTAPSSVGSITFTSSEASAFLTVTTSSGHLYHIALYP